MFFSVHLTKECSVFTTETQDIFRQKKRPVKKTTSLSIWRAWTPWKKFLWIWIRDDNAISPVNVFHFHQSFSFLCSARFEGVELFSPATQYFLTANNTFSGTRGPSSWSTIFVFHLIPLTILLTLISTTSWSRKITVPSGRKIRSISRRMSTGSHLHWFFTSANKNIYCRFGQWPEKSKCRR